jgi:FAD/FMN-containing dehydrogenase/predicted hydrocarbon binding protein
VFDAAKGEYRDGDIRYMFIRNDALMGLFAELAPEQRLPALAALARSIRRFGGKSVAAYRESGSATPERMLETIEETAPQLGWGSWTFAHEGDAIVLAIANSPFAAAARPSAHPVCHAVVGMLTALGPVLFDAEAEAVEECCAASGGGAQCRFRVRRAVAEPAGAVAALVAALGPDVVRTGDRIAPRNETDWSGTPPNRPLAVVLPSSTEQVAAALRICHAHKQSVVPQGGLTGLSGGAHPGIGDVVLSLERMTGVAEVDKAAATLTAWAGTPLQLVHEAAEAAGFACGIDLGARGSCSIGGNVATNAGGNNVLRYGMARQNVRGLEVVLADGTVVTSLNKLMKNNAGYDWTQLFIGSEGTLGVVTRVVLGLHPLVPERCAAICAIDDFSTALTVLRRLEAMLPGRLLAFEAMWADYWHYATVLAAVPAPLALQTPIALLIEVGQSSGDDILSETLGALYEDGLIRDAVVSKSETERLAFWAVREAPSEYPRLLPGALNFDVSIPLAFMETAVAELRAVLGARWPDGVAVFYGHVADSNLHMVVGPSAQGRSPKGLLEDALYAVVAKHGGSVSAEHGIGRMKRTYLPLSRKPEELALMATMKRALDPTGILNPGKVF